MGYRLAADKHLRLVCYRLKELLNTGEVRTDVALGVGCRERMSVHVHDAFEPLALFENMQYEIILGVLDRVCVA